MLAHRSPTNFMRWQDKSVQFESGKLLASKSEPQIANATQPVFKGPFTIPDILGRKRKLVAASVTQQKAVEFATSRPVVAVIFKTSHLFGKSTMTRDQVRSRVRGASRWCRNARYCEREASLTFLTFDYALPLAQFRASSQSLSLYRSLACF